MTPKEAIEFFNNCIDLVSRQQKEIKRLQKEVNLVSIQFQDLQERNETAKSEAIKEFADLMLELYEGDIVGETDCPVRIIRQNIKDIRDELIGELTERKED